MKDSEGEFGNLKKASAPCYHCKQDELYFQIWESSCGGYEDYKYQCKSCKKTWWVDGIDS